MDRNKNFLPRDLEGSILVMLKRVSLLMEKGSFCSLSLHKNYPRETKKRKSDACFPCVHSTHQIRSKCFISPREQKVAGVKKKRIGANDVTSWTRALCARLPGSKHVISVTDGWIVLKVQEVFRWKNVDIFIVHCDVTKRDLSFFRTTACPSKS